MTRLRDAGVLMAGLLLVAGFGLPVAQAADRCPAAKTCGDYTLFPYRWPNTAGQRPVVIPYQVNPSGQAMLTTAEVLGGVAAAMRTWETANPRIRFRYQGLTTALPGVNDGRNVVGFGVPVIPIARAAASTPYRDGKILEADLIFNASSKWVWDQCEQRDRACGRLPEDDVGGTNTGGVDFQGTAVHELGHWLSLNHATSDRGNQQTMYQTGPTNLSLQTLGLGDILGVRAAYPCGSCGGRPVVFMP